MNRELRWKLARMILDKSRSLMNQGIKAGCLSGELLDAVQSYFQKLGFQRVYEGYEIEEAVPWQATPGTEGPHVLFEFKPEEDHLYFAGTAPTLTGNAMVLKINRETAEKILVMGLP